METAITISITTEFTVEGLTAARTKIDQHLAALRASAMEQLRVAHQDDLQGASTGSTGVTSAGGAVAEELLQQLWNRLGSKTHKFLGDVAKTYKPGEEFTFQDLAKVLKEQVETLRSRHRNLSRSLNRVVAEMEAKGLKPPALLKKKWNYAENCYRYSLSTEVRNAILKVGAPKA